MHVVAIWLAWALQTPAIFWTLLVLLVLPALMLATRGAISRIFSPAQEAAEACVRGTCRSMGVEVV